MTQPHLMDVEKLILDEVEATIDALNGLLPQEVGAVLETLRLLPASAMVFTCGNGGSAALADHFAQDLTKTCRIAACSLAANMSAITAIGNDEKYSEVFAAQVSSMLQGEDALMCFSSSGRSPNLIAAIKAARKKHCTTIGVTSFPTGLVSNVAHLSIRVPTPEGAYRASENAQLAVAHMLIAGLT